MELGLSVEAGEGPVTIGAGIDSTIGRDNAETQTYTASVTVRF